MSVSRFLAIVGFIVIGVVSRLIPHPPNFTSITAIALFGTLYLGNRWLSLTTVLLTIFLSDLMLGFHSTMSFVYLSFALVILMANWLKEQMSMQRLPWVCLTSSLLFFFVTNFGVWMTDGLYPMTVSGLCLCYVAAIPFFVNQLLGDLTYATVLLGYFYFVKDFFLVKSEYLGDIELS